MNEICHFFGAYLEIKVRQVTTIETVWRCANGHAEYGEFCSKCGLPNAMREVSAQKYPAFICDDILPPEKWEDVITEITPESLFRSGVILAKGSVLDGTEWLYLGQWDDTPHTKPFPTQGEIEAMKDDLLSVYADIIAALRASEIVEAVTVRAGYVRDAEY